MQIRLVTMNAITGPMNTAKRMNQLMPSRLRWNLSATMSLPPAIHSRPYNVISATMIEVRVGALRGRSSRWCSRLSRVTQPSRNGYSKMTSQSTRGTTSPGIITFQLTVKPHSEVSQFGMMRSAPSAMPMYQSGCEPAVTSAGLYGPYFQTGLIVISAPISVVTPKTMKKKPPALAM